MGKVVEFPRVSRTTKPLLRHALGEVLRAERLGQERILTEVAATAGVSPQYLSEIERGRKEPSSELLGSVTEALGLDLVDVVQRVGTMLGARRDAERSAAERRELLRVETSFAFRADAAAIDIGDADDDATAGRADAIHVIDVNAPVEVAPGHPLAGPGGAYAPAGPAAYLLAA